MKTDSDLQRSVQDELKWEPGVGDSTKIGVAVKDNVVTLTGFVSSYAEKWAAERAAKRVSCVNALAIELRVQLPDHAKKTDADIAEAAANALSWDISVPTDSVSVIVENGWVTLDGSVNWQYQRLVAEDAVGALTGVTGVFNRITMKPAITPADIKSKIEAALKRNAILDAEYINVQTDGGKVTLTGTVSSWAQREEAEAAAWAAPGVSDLTDTLRIAY
jgi:osmotically-inducible protein OsmY